MSPYAPRHLTLRIAALLVLVGVCTTSLAQGEALTLQGLRAVIGQKFPDVPFVEAAALARAMQADPARRPRLFDTRGTPEYAVSHLLGALRLDPDTSDLSIAGTDKHAPIVVYCSVGYRSAAVGRSLLRAGFSDVKNLAGGIFGWANDGYSVYQGTKIVRRVHPYDAVWGLLLRADLRKSAAPP